MQGMYVERVLQMMLPNPVMRDQGVDAAKRVYQFGEIEPVAPTHGQRLKPQH